MRALHNLSAIAGSRQKNNSEGKAKRILATDIEVEFEIGYDAVELDQALWAKPGRQKGRFGNRPFLSYAEMDINGEPIALRTRRARD